MHEFEKCEVADDEEQRTAFCGKLVTWNFSKELHELAYTGDHHVS